MTTQNNIAAALPLIPADLVGDVERSLLVPQVGPYHQEGPFMEAHLERVLTTLEALAVGDRVAVLNAGRLEKELLRMLEEPDPLAMLRAMGQWLLGARVR